jgi:hypothetical protein
VEAFNYALTRVSRVAEPLLGAVDGLILNDIQGGPVGCGCGNDLCRSWDNSPGEKIAPSPYLAPERFFSLVFLAAIRGRLPSVPVVPVLCEECQTGIEVDGVLSPDDQTFECRDVPCRPCSTDYYPRLAAATASEPSVGLLALTRLWRRDRAPWGTEGEWVRGVIRRFRACGGAPPFVVLQAWASEAGSAAAGWEPPMAARREMEVAEANGAGWLLALSEIDQSWWPVEPPAGYPPPETPADGCCFAPG